MLRDTLLRSMLVLCTAALSVACDRPPVVRQCVDDATVRCPLANDPSGRIEGTVIYEGPLPPTRADGTASGRIVLLLFEAANPPPPQGTATSAVSFTTVSAAQLFQDPQVLPNGNVRASIRYVFPGIARGGVYQMRAFYSRADSITYNDGDASVSAPSGFHPLFSVRNQPVAGDVAGGAIIDPTAPITVFRTIVVGDAVLGPDGGVARYAIPENGAVVDNVTVFIGRQVPTERPMNRVLTEPEMVPGPGGVPVTLPPPIRLTLKNVAPPPGFRPTEPTSIPASAALVDYAKNTGLLPFANAQPYLEMVRNPAVTMPDTGADVPSFSIAASFRAPTATTPSECLLAAIAGVRCAASPLQQIGFYELAFDRNEDGRISIGPSGMFADIHPTLSSPNPAFMATAGRFPWLYPIVIFTKLHDPNARERALLTAGINGKLDFATYARLRSAMNTPETVDLSDPTDPRFPVVIFGTVVPGGNPANFLLNPWTSGYRTIEPYPRIAIVPVALEIRGTNPVTDWHAKIPEQLPAQIAASSPFLPLNYECKTYDAAITDPDSPQQAGLPPGRYSINIIGPSGQTWSTPNDLAEFPLPEGSPASTAALCDATTRLCRMPTQGMFLRITGAEMPPAGVVCPTPPRRP